MYTALYRTERPEVFSEVLGQEHIVRILRNQIKTGSVGHAYLFSGTRGTGKTTVARLLAKAVNCTSDGERPCGKCANCRSIQEGTFIDMIELDAASNRGIENIRELRESVNYPPAVGRRKVYIIDEVHMLTNEAHNALLKTLEEPPENIMFIMATTNPEKLPQTILSRCMRFDFRRVPEDKIEAHMAEICRKRGLKATDGALKLLATNADGSVRDGLSLLDQCISGSEEVLDRDLVLEYLGAVSDDFYLQLTDHIRRKETAEALLLLDEAIREGKDVGQILTGWLSHYRSLLIGKYVDEPEDLLNISEENADKIIAQAELLTLQEINKGIVTIARTIMDSKYSTQARTLAELAIVVLSNDGREEDEQPIVSQKAQSHRTKRKEVKEHKDKTDKSVEVAHKPSDTMNKTSPVSRPEEKKEKPRHRASGKVVKKSLDGKQGDRKEVKKSSNKTFAGTDYSTEDLQDIWDDVWERIGKTSGSLYLARANTILTGIKGQEFKVLVKNAITLAIIERNRETIVSAMSELLARPMKMVVSSSEDSTDSEEDKEVPPVNDEEAEKIAEELRNKLGVDPQIK